MGEKGISQYIKIGERIKKMRISHNYTQHEFAKKIGIPVSTYSNYENGNRTPNLDVLKKIAAGLNEPLSKFILVVPADGELTIGERIRIARKEAGLTQEQLGERANIAKTTIRKYELGRLNPERETIEKIANALEVSPFALMDFKMGIPIIREMEKNSSISNEFINFSNFIDEIGYRIIREESKYYLVNGNEKKEIRHEELKTLVKTSKTVLKGILDSFMNED